MSKYIPSDIEPKWQKKWQENNLYRAENESKKPKKYILDMFPYPSGDRLHVGHFKGYIATDVISRYFRLRGFNVLHPMGWDAFGLPAENYALQTGIHPRISTSQNIESMKKQMRMISLSYDWTREINTTDPQYYKWTQWIFLKMFEKGLAYEDEAPINWCPVDKTGLANEEVMDGKCERCGSLVQRKNIRQWLLKITAYADRLLEDLDSLDWPKAIKEMQINWIGRKEGINITYKIEGSDQEIICFTTRPDTNFGATFIVLGPEHPVIQKITQREYLDVVNNYISTSINKSEEERIALGRIKTGVFTGSFAINNLTGEKMPVWVSDFVLGHVGTGAVVGVPGHDLRDFEFAKEFELPIKRVVVGEDGDQSEITKPEQVQEDTGIMIHSEFLDGLDIHEATKKMMDYLEKQGWGKRVIDYHLRDWLFSRQRYWGEPIPVIHCQKCTVVAVPEDELPVMLPEVAKYEPTGTGDSPLAAISDWVNTKCPKCGGSGKRETNTMPQWAGSCWYYSRFCDSKNDQVLIDKDIERYWMPVDWYVGGSEHAVLHLLYARFWHKFLFDIGVVGGSEPFQKLTNVGLVLAADGRKMSKRWGNVILAEDIVKEYGADTLRVYECFMGPFENIISWDPKSINGVYRFLQRIWGLQEKLTINDERLTMNDLKIMHKTIKKVTEDIENIKLNTAIAALMEWLNYLSKKEKVEKEGYKIFLLLLAPFAPHITEELWSHFAEASRDGKWSIHQQSWPSFDNKFLEEEQISIAIQVSGKLRDILAIEKDIINNRAEVEKRAKESQKVSKFLEGKTIERVVYVPGKIISFVISNQ